MPPAGLVQTSPIEWRIPRQGRMRVDGVLLADAALIHAMDAKVADQVANVACLPGIVGASLAMPDAHSGYGFPIGGVAAFDADAGGVVSAGGVGFDIACGVRALTTGIDAEDIRAVQKELADLLFARIPAGVGEGGPIHLDRRGIDAMLAGGAQWAVAQGFGERADLDRIEEGGRMTGADPDAVSDAAKKRAARAIGTLGSGNHYLEIQEIVEIFDAQAADAFGLVRGKTLLAIHCGSRGLGHQIGKDYMAVMKKEAPKHGLRLPDKELACAPIHSALGQRYLEAMHAGVNCALANRQALTHLAREAFAAILPRACLRLVYDVSHNTCKLEQHVVGGKRKMLHVHRKGATRAFGPGHPDLPHPLRAVGQPVLVGGSMGTSSYILAGLASSMERSFGSANHGAGRCLSRSAAKRQFNGPDTIAALAHQGIAIRAHDFRGVAEEAPGAYKDIDAVVQVTEQAGLARRVARLQPLVCVKG
ncbi:MAG: RtcB family protein [Desulfovibrionaceae bacterium]